MLANIVKGDIPVSNGIVHLIDKPLVIVANNLWEFFKNERNGTRLSKFAGFLTREGAELKELVSSVKDGTIFAPSDKAFSTVLEDELLKDDDRLKSIIGMHLLDKRIAGDDIRVLQPQNGLGVRFTITNFELAGSYHGFCEFFFKFFSKFCQIVTNKKHTKDQVMIFGQKLTNLII